MLNELSKKKGVSIFTFKKGDIIIRLEAAILKNVSHNENLGIDTEAAYGIDQSFREPMEFIAIENNIIYLKYVGGYCKGRVSKANLDVFAEDWALFVIPNGLTLDDCC
jgi:hypothetical protein